MYYFNIAAIPAGGACTEDDECVSNAECHTDVCSCRPGYVHEDSGLCSKSNSP